MPVICPTVTAQSSTEFRAQMERIHGFSKRIHLDFMDGIFAPNKSIPIASAWWQPGPIVDLHVMYKNPLSEIENIIMLQPHLVIIHAEAERVFDFLHELDELGIKKGIALLKDTPVSAIESLLPLLDHVLIFSGELGCFGGTADVQLLQKAALIKNLRPKIEIGWDGGINLENAASLASGGIDVLNTGGFIHNSENPEAAYDTLEKAIAEGK
ncbi:ribulose-phosphate 3-epimerase [soil metagenome]